MFLFILRLKGGYTGWFFKRDNFLKKMGDAIVLAEIKKQFSVFIMKMLTKKKKVLAFIITFLLDTIILTFLGILNIVNSFCQKEWLG